MHSNQHHEYHHSSNLVALLKVILALIVLITLAVVAPFDIVSILIPMRVSALASFETARFHLSLRLVYADLEGFDV